MLNLLVSLLNDLYEELKGLAKADWCRAQVRSFATAGGVDGIAGGLRTVSETSIIEKFWRKAKGMDDRTGSKHVTRDSRIIQRDIGHETHIYMFICAAYRLFLGYRRFTYIVLVVFVGLGGCCCLLFPVGGRTHHTRGVPR